MWFFFGLALTIMMTCLHSLAIHIYVAVFVCRTLDAGNKTDYKSLQFIPDLSCTAELERLPPAFGQTVKYKCDVCVF